ncbi:short-chain dehydrogenase [Verrucomicrobia bacterium LW23]|nr:short-chain dehydrogenase [Verrucomicrobia bacterium LW23]
MQDKVIVVIGGTTGLGFSAARAFVNAGSSVVVVGLDDSSTSEALSLLQAPGSCHEGQIGGTKARVRGLTGNATFPETARRAIAEAVNTFGRLDGLYHVAGGSGRLMGDGPLGDITDEGWDATLELNLTSLFYSNRAAVRQFLDQGGGGSILNLGSVLGWSPAPRYFGTHAYAAAKAAVVGLTKSAAAYYASSGIRFNVLAPALVETPMSRRAVADKAIMSYVRRKQPLDGGRIGQPSDLDAAAVYFMSDGSRFTTGQVLSIDGGWSICEGALEEA